MLCPWLPDLIQLARKLGLTTSVVTNGSRITQGFLDGIDGRLDWAAVSVDSVNPEDAHQNGSGLQGLGPMTSNDYLAAIADLRQTWSAYQGQHRCNTWKS